MTAFIAEPRGYCKPPARRARSAPAGAGYKSRTRQGMEPHGLRIIRDYETTPYRRGTERKLAQVRAAARRAGACRRIRSTELGRAPEHKKSAGAGAAGRPGNSGTVIILPLKFAPPRQDRHPNAGVRRSQPASTTHCPDEKPPCAGAMNSLPLRGREFVANLRSSSTNPRRNRLTEA